ncbi:hypothetical protein K435DRAFT_848005 [Dendrothele bispora CBS 962.96]|uniref:CN hydrolase domain-containing protein n=1 Tax=Dendrothele bispora (strain CBS 962.96) TaxID=1314807 RepID=A0A4S8MW95_DENBC|nr:hypothetical protein K435DRAFT_848005 [Dendrothele bispora CBS 962.96]
MDLRTIAFHRHPHICLGSLSFISAVFALGLNTVPSFIPLVIHLSLVIIYVSRSALTRFPGRLIILWIVLSVGKSIGWLKASLGALSTPATSLSVLFAQSLFSTLLTLALIVFYTRSRTQLSLPYLSQVTLFPALWTLVWYLIARINPVGYLGLPAPAYGLHSYEWMIPIFGSMTKHWVLAAWAVVCSQTVEWWFITSQESEEQSLIDHPHSQYGTIGNENGNGSSDRHSSKSLRANANHTFFFASFLLALTVPSFFLSDLPLPVGPIENITPVTVGCVLPVKQVYKTEALTFEHYLQETKTLTPHANVLLWPEGAVFFQSTEERKEKLGQVQDAIQGPRFVAVSFEENYVEPTNPHKTLRRTGVAVVSGAQKVKDEPHLIYWKRNLVPIAESFSLQKGIESPPLTTLLLPPPHGITKPEWGSTRPLTVSASICLDFATPSAFSDLISRPALILAPARTWNVDVGLAMWDQARARAQETGSTVLWCDGGEGGVSGVVGGGIDNIVRVGEGSWFHEIGFQYPFDERQTVYARTGSVLGIMLVWVLVLGGTLEGVSLRFLTLGIQSLRVPRMQWIMGRVPAMIRRKHDIEQPLIRVEEEQDLLN